MHVSALWRYPVKSCQGNALAEAAVDEFGIENDREFVIAALDGRVLTQKTLPTLNLISATLTNASLLMAFPGKAEIAVDLAARGSQLTVDMFGEVPGECMGPAAAAWLSEVLDRPCRLVRSHEPFSRKMIPQVAHLFLDLQRRYPDASPIHLICQSSLDDLNDRAGDGLAMSRFRPNIVVEGARAYAEDSWKSVRIGELLLEYMGPCERCGVTLVAPGTDKRGIEPLQTLRAYRTMEGGFTGGIIFGSFFRPARPGVVRVGDPVEILQVGAVPPMRGDLA